MRERKKEIKSVGEIRAIVYILLLQLLLTTLCLLFTFESTRKPERRYKRDSGAREEGETSVEAGWQIVNNCQLTLSNEDSFLFIWLTRNRNTINEQKRSRMTVETSLSSRELTRFWWLRMVSTRN